MLKTVSSVTNALGALVYQGTWDASANNPTLTSSVGTKGNYYVVSVAGTTTLNGISSWSVGDWAVFNGSVWQKVDGGTSESFVNLTVTNNSNLTNLSITGNVSFTAPVTITNDYTVSTGDRWIINNKSGSDLTVTLPTASSSTGRIVTIQNYQTQNVASASSNVVPQGGGSAGTAILLNVAGNWATLVSNGTNWVIMEAAAYNNLLLG